MQTDSGSQTTLGAQSVQQGSCLKGRYILARALPLNEPGQLYAGRDQRTGEALRIRSIPTGNLSETARTELGETAYLLMEVRRDEFFPRVRDFIEAEGVCFLVQDGTEGIPLPDFIAQDLPTLPGRMRIAHIFRQVADRLAYLHDHVHGPILFRDLTPDRVLVDPSTRLVRLVDHCLPGLAQGAPEGSPGKGTGQTLAPELYRGEPHSIQTDVYALGRILQYVIFGETDADPDPSTPIPTAVGRGVPETLRELVRRMIAPDPSLRPRTVQEAKVAFEACLDVNGDSMQVAGATAAKDRCSSCGADADADNLCCPYCGSVAVTDHGGDDAEITVPPVVRVSGLESERFVSLKPVSLERFSLLKMSAKVARLGNYENLCVDPEAHKGSARRLLAEVLHVLRDLRGRALVVASDPMTPVTLATTLLAEYRSRDWTPRCLILAPGALARSWQRRLAARHDIEAEVLDPDPASGPSSLPDTPVLIASPENLFERAQRDAALAATWDLVAVDAAHLFTSKGSHRWRLLEALRSKYFLLLTSNPVQDDLSELHNLLRLVRPDLWNSSAQDFRASVDTTLPATRDKIERTMLEMLRSEPWPILQTHYELAHLEGEAAELYNVILNSLSGTGLDPRTTMLIKRALITASPARLATAADDETAAALIAGVRALLEGDLHPKISHLLARVAPAVDGKAVVFSGDQEVRTKLVGSLKRAGFKAVNADGKGSGRGRAAWRRFASDSETRFLVMGDDDPAALPFNVADTAIFFDMPWEPGRIADRVSRLCSATEGGRVLHVVQLLAPGTVEEWLYDLYQDALQVYTPGSGMLHAFEAAMHESESFAGLIEQVASTGIQGNQGEALARQIRERIAGVREHITGARRVSDEVMRLFRREEER